MTFNVFTVLNNTKLINDAIKNIPQEDVIQLWVTDDFKGESELCRPCLIKVFYKQGPTYAQWMNGMMHDALLKKEKWVGWLHDDVTISLEDLQNLKNAIHEVPSCVYKINCVRSDSIGTTRSAPTDLYVFYNTARYWEVGGYDTKYHVYWSDIDFHIRQLEVGNLQHGVDTPSVTHIGSSSLHGNNRFQSIVNEMVREFDFKYHAFKHPTFRHPHQ